MSDELEPLPPHLARLLDAERGEETLAPERLGELRARIERAVRPGAHFLRRLRLRLRRNASRGHACSGGARGAARRGRRWGVAASAPPPVETTTAAQPAPVASSAPEPIASRPVASAERPFVRAASGCPDGSRGRDKQRRHALGRAPSRRPRPHNPRARRCRRGALAAIHDHEESYPRGALIEEREYIAILALQRSGRADDASRRAKRFRRMFPSSVYASSVGAVADAPR